MLRLLARGLSNQQIAERLVISRRTAEHHVQHIYTKIGHSTRAAATLFAMEHDLLRLPDELPHDPRHHGRIGAVRDMGVTGAASVLGRPGSRRVLPSWPA